MDLINKQFDSLPINSGGTENMSIFLYSLVRFTKPKKILEIGIGHTTLFLSFALKDIKSQMLTLDSNSWIQNKDYFQNSYNPILDVVENSSQIDSTTLNNHLNILKENNLHKNVKIYNQDFWEFYSSSTKDYDFIWVDAGSLNDYYKIMDIIYPNIPYGGTIIFHNTLSKVDGKLFETNLKLYQRENKIQDLEIISFLEPHKNNQNCFTICKKSYKHGF